MEQFFTRVFINVFAVSLIENMFNTEFAMRRFEGKFVYKYNSQTLLSLLHPKDAFSFTYYS